MTPEQQRRGEWQQPSGNSPHQAARVNTKRRLTVVGALALAGGALALWTLPLAPSVENAVSSRASEAPFKSPIKEAGATAAANQQAETTRGVRNIASPQNGPSLGIPASVNRSASGAPLSPSDVQHNIHQGPKTHQTAPEVVRQLASLGTHTTHGEPALLPFAQPTTTQTMAALRLHHPSGSDLATIDALNENVFQKGDNDPNLAMGSPVQMPSATDLEAQRQQELSKIRKEMKQPVPKRKLDSTLYDPWASEYQNLVQREQAEANQQALAALRARQDEERRKAQQKKKTQVR